MWPHHVVRPREGCTHLHQEFELSIEEDIFDVTGLECPTVAIYQFSRILAAVSHR